MAPILNGQSLNGGVGIVEHVNAHVIWILDSNIVQRWIAIVNGNAPFRVLDVEMIDDTASTSTTCVELNPLVGNGIRCAIDGCRTGGGSIDI